MQLTIQRPHRLYLAEAMATSLLKNKAVPADPLALGRDFSRQVVVKAARVAGGRVRGRVYISKTEARCWNDLTAPVKNLEDFTAVDEVVVDDPASPADAPDVTPEERADERAYWWGREHRPEFFEAVYPRRFELRVA